ASSAGEVVAKVRGTEKYKVRIRLRGIKLIATCTCPYFGPAGAPCKHLWATVLAVDARGLLPSAPTRPLRLVTDSAPRQGNYPTDGTFEGPPPPPTYDPLPYPLPNLGPGQQFPPRGPQGPPRGQGQGPPRGQGQGPPRGQGQGQGH